ncbi:MAG: hypothetical protein EZS28_007617 [Streblomastix strix]|uniref:Cation transporter n=1 Tax=Streblomastix strix TaxID=222440 RepID=A0A5J4WPE8_9EUKA|nr:MAG: hypothetical protein EZS28_007617 [Streblomastix strix]
MLHRLIHFLKDIFFSYLLIHMLYILSVSLLAGLAIYLIEQDNLQAKDLIPGHEDSIKIDFMDCFYLSMSSITDTGMSTLKFFKLHLSTQWISLILMQLGSNVMLSLVPIIIRRYQFRQHLKQHKRVIWYSSDCVYGFEDRIFYKGDTMHPEGVAVEYQDPNGYVPKVKEKIKLKLKMNKKLKARLKEKEKRRRKEKLKKKQNREKIDKKQKDQKISKKKIKPEDRENNDEKEDDQYLLLNKNEDLIKKQAMGKIIKYVWLYIFIIYTVGFIWIYIASSLLPWMQEVLSYQLEYQGISAVRFSIFAVVSSFNNAMLSILDYGSLSDIRGQWAVILPIGLLIAAGHTMFPVFFRLMIEITKDKGGSQRPIYHYLMVSSRKCYTHMFSSVQTRTLAYLFGIMTLIQLIPILGIDWKTLKYQQKQ